MAFSMPRFARFRRPSGQAFMEQSWHTGPRPDPGRPATAFEDLFWGNTGRVIDKWHHLLPLYDRYFGPFRGKPVRMLEIGVYKGGSLAMWRRYFGPEAIIFGIDINPDCARFDGEDASVRIGSQDDPAFLRRVVEEMGGVDLVLDDGSHMARHIQTSFEVLFPLVSEGGIYAVEDLCTSYWRDFAGKTRLTRNFFDIVPKLIDDMHHWYHPYGQEVEATKDSLVGIHIHDSFMVFDKGAQQEPKRTAIGTQEA